MIEDSLLTFALNNGVGVLFGLLMYWMAERLRKENVDSTLLLKEAIVNLSNLIDKKFK